MAGQYWQLARTTAGFLLGEWHAQRRVDDQLTGLAGWFAGRPTFRQHAAEISYQEDGELRFGGHVGPAGRRLRYRPCRDGAIEVLFADGRPFYLLDLQSGACEAEHPCGPATDYETTTTFTRVGA